MQLLIPYLKPCLHFLNLSESDISKESFSKADLNSISKAFALLHKRGLVKRVKRQVYMINPNAIITDNWKDHNNKWQSIP